MQVVADEWRGVVQANRRDSLFNKVIISASRHEQSHRIDAGRTRERGILERNKQAVHITAYLFNRYKADDGVEDRRWRVGWRL